METTGVKICVAAGVRLRTERRTDVDQNWQTKKKKNKRKTTQEKQSVRLWCKRKKTKYDFYACAIAGVETGAVVMEARHCGGTADAFFGAGMLRRAQAAC